MKLGIIGWDYEEPETLSLASCGRKMGLDVTLFTLKDVSVRVHDGASRTYANGVAIDELDAIVSRAQLRDGAWRQDVERLFAVESAARSLTDLAGAFVTGESKLLALQRLSMAGLPVPSTTVCATTDEVRAAWEASRPIVVKPSYGYAGHDVERIVDDFDAMAPRLRELLQLHGSLLVQEFIPHPQGDIRATVIGDEVAFGIRRIPNDRTWKANVAQGADWVRYHPSPEICELSLAAARCMGITIAGLDILASNGRHVILEINNVPGWYFFDEHEIDDVCRKIIEHAFKMAGKAIAPPSQPTPAGAPGSPSRCEGDWAERWLDAQETIGRAAACQCRR